MPTQNNEPEITLQGVRQNNLKNIDVNIPVEQLTVITGVSGSGKSSLAFETLYAEGQRRYIESLSTYTRQFLEKMPKPDLDLIRNIPPSIALEQRNQIVNSRSTVGSQTELVDYLRILFSKIGDTKCRNCGGEVTTINPSVILNASLKWLPKRKALILAPFPSKSGKVTFNSITTVLKGQGYHRIYLDSKSPKMLDLEEIATSSEAEKKQIQKTWLDGKLYLVIDRLKVSTKPDTSLRSRVLDSIEQAITVGRGAVQFLDIDSQDWLKYRVAFSCVECGTEHPKPEPNLFSFNSPLGACAKCSGFGFTLDVDEAKVVPDPNKTIKNGAIDPFSKPSLTDWQVDMFRFLERHGISVGKRYRELTKKEKELLWNGDAGDTTFPGILKCFEHMARWKYKIHVRVFIRRYQSQNICPDCKGARLQSDALHVFVKQKNIADVLNMTIHDARTWFDGLKLKKSAQDTVQDVLPQVKKRLYFLDTVGVGYLTLSRLSKTLSGGEYQRINLATQLGNGLCGTLYVLDEPSIGLHAADTERLIRVLQDLKNQGNSVVVVEHDLDVIRNAQWLIELGPAAGRRGGELIYSGPADQIESSKGSLTAKYISGAFHIERPVPYRPEATKYIEIKGCRENNLKNVSAKFPLERFTVVTGVSGSGKSTLVHTTLYRALRTVFENDLPVGMEPGEYSQLYGADFVSGITLLDQKPIGKNSRSNPATYLKIWDEIRRIYANQVVAIRRGYTPQYFSFNVDGGRCPVCKGEGEVTIDMHFMAEVKLPCDECEGKRFKAKVLDVEYKRKNIYQIMQTTIDEAYDLFRGNVLLTRKLGILREVGLGYLHLGQSATTLSGGESQRLKIASVLDNQKQVGFQNQLYIFDEPTTGLHLEDIKKLMTVIQDLVQAKNTVIMIEHQLDVIAQADWVIDLGPGGGEDGGTIIAAGSPSQVIRDSKSITGAQLKKQGYNLPSPRDLPVETTISQIDHF